MKVIKNYQVSLKLLAELTLLLIILINLLSLFHSTIYFVTTHQANYYFILKIFMAQVDCYFKQQILINLTKFVY